MTEAEFQAILARNPQISTNETGFIRQVFASKPEPGTSDAPDPVVGRKTKSQGSIVVRFTICCLKLSDVDAIHGRGKDLLDGLADAGLIPGDRQDQIRYEALERKVAKRKDQGVRIEIDYGEMGR